MKYNKKVQKFTEIWIKVLESRDIDYNHLFSKEFQVECEDMGFKLLSTQETDKLYFVAKKLKDVTHDDNITDYKKVGSIIYSAWNLYHKYYLTNENEELDFAEFIRLLHYLKFITSKDIYKSISNQKSVVIKSRIWSKPFDDNTETEQTLEIFPNGNIIFKSKTFDSILKEISIKIDEKTAMKIISDLYIFYSNIYFWDEYEVGDEWNIKFNDGETKRELSACYSNFIVNSNDISSTIRSIIPIDNMKLFDGKSEGDKILKIMLDLKNSNGESIEKLIVDKESSEINISKRDEEGNTVTINYMLNDDIKILLNSFDIKKTFEFDTDDFETDKKLQIKVEYKHSDSYNKLINYNRNNFSSNLLSFIGEISKLIVKHTKFKLFCEELNFLTDRDVKYRFASVAFIVGGKSYSYVLEDDSIRIGDFVEVPVGSDGEVKEAIVVDINYYTEEDAPYPYKKTKRVIGKCDEDDLWDSDLYLEEETEFSNYLYDAEELKDILIEDFGGKFDYTFHTNAEEKYQDYTDDDIIIEFINPNEDKNLSVVIGYQMEVLFLGHKEVFYRFELFFSQMKKYIDEILNSKYGISRLYVDDKLVLEGVYCDLATPFTEPREVTDLSVIDDENTFFRINIAYWSQKADTEWYLSWGDIVENTRYIVIINQKFYLVYNSSIIAIGSVKAIDKDLFIEEFKIFTHIETDGIKVLNAIEIYGKNCGCNKILITAPVDFRGILESSGFYETDKETDLNTLYCEDYANIKTYNKDIK